MKKPSKQTLGMFALAGIVVGVSFMVLLLVGAMVSWNVHGRGLSVVSAVTGNLVRAFDAFGRGFRGHDPILALEQTNARLRGQVAALQDVAEENEFLRNVAELPARYERRALIGGVFNYGAVGQRMQMVLNIGSSDGVVPGSTVVTESGALLGLVNDVRERSSTLLVLGDPAVQVTGRIVETDIGGLVRVDPTGQLGLELIGKDESVTEGALVVASGLDAVPAGLPIGTVRSVDAERATLFQVIRVTPAHQEETVWRVLVLLP